MRTITRIAVINEGLVINTYPSIVDTARGERSGLLMAI